MGTKVHHKTQLPCHFPLSDLNEKPRSFSYLYIDDNKTIAGQPYNDIKQWPLNGYLGCDKEMLKRTMLEHEATFRKQVHELHRLYKIQKDLMVQLNINHLLEHSGPICSFKSNIISSHLSPQNTERTWHSNVPSENKDKLFDVNVTSCSDTMTSVNLRMEGCSKHDIISGGNEGFPKDSHYLTSTLSTGSERTFDLHQNEKQTKIRNVAESLVLSVAPDYDLKIAFSGVTAHSHGAINLKPNTDQRDGSPTYVLTDLNEPPKDPSSDEEDGQREQSHFSQIKREAREEQSVQYVNFGQNKKIGNSFSFSLCSKKYPMSSEAIGLKLKGMPTYCSPDKNQSGNWFGKSIMQPSGSYLPGPSTSQATNSLPETYQTTWRKSGKEVEHIPIAVQALPCFNESATVNGHIRSRNANTQSNKCGYSKLQPNSNLQVLLQNNNKSSSHSNGIYHEFRLELNVSADNHVSRSTPDEKHLNIVGDKLSYEESKASVKDLNLNLAPDGVQLGVNNQNEIGHKFDELNEKQLFQKLACSEGEQHNPSHVDLGMSKSFTQLMSSFDKVACQSAREEQRKIIYLPYGPQNTPSPFQTKDDQDRRISYAPSRNDSVRNSFYIKDWCGSTSSNSFHELSSANDLMHNSKEMGIRNRVTFNSTFTPQNDSKLQPGISSKDDKRFPSSISFQNIPAIVTHTVDPEAPAIELKQDGTTSLDASKRMSNLNMPINVSQIDEIPLDGSQRLAAYIIVSMSKDACYNLDTVGSCLESPASDLLHWFAELVTSKRREAGSEASDDELDLFESMTLKLEEVQEEDYWPRPCMPENHRDDNDKCTTSSPSTRSRRGQARNQRQQKKFQKDILPSVSSLSRNKVTEDLQVFELLTKPSNKGRQTGTKRRRNMLSCQTREKLRPTSLDISTEEVHVDAFPFQLADTEISIAERSIQGWGRRTRRCRTQRVSSSSTITRLT